MEVIWGKSGPPKVSVCPFMDSEGLHKLRAKSEGQNSQIKGAEDNG